MAGPPALLLPGTLCDARLFQPLLDRLDLDATVAGHGKAASLEEAAAAALALAPVRFVAIGFSLGGFVALELLRRAPSRLLGLVLIASHAHPDTPAAAAERARQAARFRSGGASAWVEDLWVRQVGPAALGRASVRATIAAMAASFDDAAFARQSAIAASRPDAQAHGNPAGVPALVVAGSEDALCPPARSAAAAAALGAYMELPGIGHYIPLEAPDALASALRPWLAELREPVACG